MDAWLETLSTWLAPFATLALVAVGLAVVSVLFLAISLVARRRTSRRAVVRRGPEPSAGTSGVSQVEEVLAKPGAVSSTRSRAAIWLRRASLVGVTLVAALAVSLGVLDRWYFSDVVRWLCGQVEATSGIRLEFAEAQGSLWRGEIELVGIRARRGGNRGSFDLSAERVQVDIAMRTLLAIPAFESLEVTNLSGQVTLGPKDEPATRRRPFEIRRFVVRGADLQVLGPLRNDQTLNIALRVDRWESQPLRSHWLAYDLVFRTNASGRVADVPFTGQSRRDSQSRYCRWQADGLPLNVARYAVGPPFTWLREGTVDVSLTEEAMPATAEVLQGRCRLVLRDVDVELPDNLPATLSVPLTPITAWIRTAGREVPLEFPVRMNVRDFANRLTPQAAGLDDALANGLLGEMGNRAGVDLEQFQRRSHGVLDRLREFLSQ